ncbi:MAG: hypothetical protein AABW53_01220 [Nanoarchaeota archaeon]
MKFFLLLVLLFSLFSGSVLAESSLVSAPIKNEITTLEEASFSLTITNNADQTQRYSIYSLQSGQGWNVDAFPLRDKIIELAPGRSHTTTIIAKALGDFPPGIYFVYVTIQSDLGESYDEALKIYLKPKEPMDYIPAIKVVVDMADKVNPREPLSIKLFLENRNPLDLTGLKIRLQTEIPEFEKELSVDLSPLQKKTVEFSVVPNPYQQPKEYALFFVFERNGEMVKIIEQKMEILSLMPPFEVISTEEEKYLKTSKTLTVKNIGNVRNTQIVKEPVSLWSALFTSSDDNEGKMLLEEEQRYLSWEMSLGPGETVDIPMTVNYRIIAYVLAALLLFAGFYFYVQSPISVQKTATTSRSNEDGTLSEVKITLELRNHSKKLIKEVIVTDLVPSIANIDRGLELGTLKPQEIKQTKMGTKVTWSLAELDSHEQRLISYKIKAKLNILGTFSLPRATVEFKRKKGSRLSKAYSNVFRLE